ncbi:MAG: YcaO-like family protein, partial [Ktedonobacteraceae bacterium]|nr:YcaO-like family protein [Ktedonobacteraceae bacterium]
MMQPFGDCNADEDVDGSVVTKNGQKSIVLGTHRVCAPEETFKRVQPFFSHMGITRIADVTRLDNIGIPVFQAIRPGTMTLCVSQGKGLTPALAKISAVMESIETWHSEHPALPSIKEEVGTMSSQIPYSIYDLNVVEGHLIHDRLLLNWFPATILGTRDQTFVPADYVHLDFRASDEWLLPTFSMTSNGLASGNSKEEAILHGLYEAIERDSVSRTWTGEIAKIQVDPATVDGPASATLIEHLHRARVDMDIVYNQGKTGIPCFSASIVSPEYPMICGGFGCHLDRDVALSRALTEAVQSRLTFISGARDDIDMRFYARVKRRRGPLTLEQYAKPLMDFHDIPTTYFPTLKEDLQEATRRVLTVVDCPPIV